MGVPFVEPNFITGSENDRRSVLNRGALVAEWRKKHGNVFGYFRGGTPILVVSDLDMMKQILVKDFGVFRNRPAFNFQTKYTKSSLLALRDRRWKEIRSVLTPAFSAAKMKLFTDSMKMKVEKMMEIMEGQRLEDSSVDVYETYQGLTMDVICECALAYKWNNQGKHDTLIKNVRKLLSGKMSFLQVFVIYFPIFQPILLRLAEFFGPGKVMASINKNVLQVLNARKKIAAQNIRNIDMVQLMLDASETAKANGFSSSSGVLSKGISLNDQEISCNAIVFLLAGFETTAAALTFTSYLLSKNPKVQEKLYDEIISIMPNPDEDVTYERVADLKYLDQVLSESLRVFPPVSEFGREVSEEIEVGGIKIPPGVVILIPVWALHRDPKLWEDAAQFQPERWSNPSDLPQMAYLPFGTGPRVCIEKRFALLEAKLALINVIRRYRLEPPQGAADDLTFAYPNAVITPIGGMSVVLKKR